MNDERYKKFKASALQFTAYRERAPLEVANKLEEWDAKPQEIERLLKELKEENFIDEERFARAFCHDKFLINKWGKRRISREISKFGLPKPVVEQGLEYIDQKKYETTLAHLAKLKWDKLKDLEVFKRKQKTIKHLLQKGYEYELIWDVVTEMKI